MNALTDCLALKTSRKSAIKKYFHSRRSHVIPTIHFVFVTSNGIGGLKNNEDATIIYFCETSSSEKCIQIQIRSRFFYSISRIKYLHVFTFNQPKMIPKVCISPFSFYSFS